ncbi:hypothetical protein H4R18_005583 [Coemansia javaensis]|uniref:Uncharacterized protein n=1 Tax=Coemansia javaensis TaxID=2761396 RepID=A0A9W8H217_9FUNG|nr:hypothetical protein H4R18_005583 [Coemansia javaensis]
MAAQEAGGARTWRRVAWGAGAAGAAGAAVGLNVAIVRNLQPIARHALTMGANWALLGAAFVAAREALLAEQAAKNARLRLRAAQTRAGDELFSSAVAGAVAGAALAFAARRTRAAAATGAVAFGALAAAAQAALTAANDARQTRILRRMGVLPAAPPQPSLAARARALVAADPVALLPDWFPLRRLAPGEYRAMLLRRRAELLADVAALRAAAEALDAREHALQQQLAG